MNTNQAQEQKTKLDEIANNAVRYGNTNTARQKSTGIPVNVK